MTHGAAQILDTASEDQKNVKLFVASQTRLVWRQFRRHRVALVSGFILLAMYVIALVAPFVAVYDTAKSSSRYAYAPPMTVHWFERTEDGSIRFAPHTFDFAVKVDPAAMRRTFEPQETKKIYLGFFVRGAEYSLYGLATNIHLFGPIEPSQPLYLMGADRIGRDVFSRLVYGTQISLSIGLVGVFLSLTLGMILGGVSGYYGGATDSVIQRIIEFVRSIPTIPLWMGLAAALPRDWGPIQVYFAITVILSLAGWTSLARVVRGKFLSLREEDFVRAAKLDGAGESRIIFRHMMPAVTSHIIASVTLAIPFMIMAETALSFLGIGLRPPVVSWGTLLQDAQSVRAVTTAPWLMLPALPVILSVLTFNFLGDGLRDAADPYAATMRR
jgi:peptide/nickel transport system permease protein